ncbi:MAG: hypothetical protein HYZ29_09040 [Myxococcales bacterium]|nr:hypothetical protein [Myxococcales bacterium]
MSHDWPDASIAEPLRRRLPFLFAVALGACTKPSPSESTPSAPPVAAAPAQAAPSGPAQSGECPMAIVPGVALGPIRIGETPAELARHGLPVKATSSYDSTEFYEVGPYHAKLCGGKVVDAWIDDLRKAPDCVTVGGKKLERTIDRLQLIGLFSGCKDAPPRTGGDFKECESGGLRVGWGMGEFIQIRVGKKGTRLDDSCEMLLDDGKPVALPAAEKAKMLQKVLDLDLLAPFWHREQPGRDPLKVIENEATADKPDLTIFGSKVIWVKKGDAQQQKLPFFEFEKLTASATKARLEFRFPVEGVVGHAEFEKRGDNWYPSDKQVAER